MPHEMHPFDFGPGRLANGVRERADGLGDGFAEAHRALGRGHQMHDIDALFGIEAFGINSGDRLFVEYEPDAYENREEIIRRFALVALFDRKASIKAALSSYNALSTGLYLYLCRLAGSVQPRMPRFFYCCGEKAGPWILLELDPMTGAEVETGRPLIMADNIRKVWNDIGLSSLRRELRSWIVKVEP